MPCLIMCTTVSLGLCMSTGDSGALLSAALKTWVQGSGTPSWAAPPASHGALPRAPSHAVYSVRPLSSARPSTTALRATRLRPAAGGPTAGRSQRRSPSPSGGQGRRSAPRHTTGQGRQSAVGELEDLAQALQRGRKRSSAGLQREMVGLCEVVHTSAAGYGAEDLCRVARALATLGACNKAFHAHLHGPGRGVLRAISGRVLELDGQDLSARQGAQLLHAFGKMQVNDKALVQRSAQAILRGPVNWQGIAMSMWGLAKMRSSQTAVLDAFTSRIASGAVTGEPAASHLAQVAWALGKCRVRRPGVMTMIATWTLQEGALDTFKPQEISNTVWAYATLDVLHPRLMAAIAARTLQAGALERFAPQAVANTVWAFATLGVYHPKLMAAIAARTLQEGALYRFKPQEIANTVWAFATLNVHHPKLMAAIAARMLQEGALDTFKPQEISNTVWAYATLDFLHPRLMAAIAARTLQAGALERFAPQAVANTVWAFATLGVYHPKLMAAIAARTLQEGALYRFKPQEIANTVWAFGLLGVHHPRLMAAIAAQMQQEGALGQFDMQNVANTAWAFATLGALRPQLAAAFSTYVNQNVQDPPAMLPWQEVTSLAWALTVSDAFHDIATSKLLKLAAAAYAREDVSRQGLFQLHQVSCKVICSDCYTRVVLNSNGVGGIGTELVATHVRPAMTGVLAGAVACVLCFAIPTRRVYDGAVICNTFPTRCSVRSSFTCTCMSPTFHSATSCSPTSAVLWTAVHMRSPRQGLSPLRSCRALWQQRCGGSESSSARRWYRRMVEGTAWT